MTNEKILNWSAIFLVPVIIFILSPIWTSNFKDYKDIEYDIISESQIAGQETKYKEWPDINILYKDKKLDEAAFIRIFIKNTGTLPIVQSDFHKPITITFDEESKVEGLRKVTSYPKDLEVTGKITKNSIQISPILLNPEDAYIIELFVQGKAEIKSVTSRITGVKEFKAAVKSEKSGLYLEHVTQESQKGHSSHKPLVKLNRYILFVISVFCLTLTFLTVFAKSKNVKSTNAFIFPRLLSLGNYIAGLASATFYAFSYIEASTFYVLFSLLLPLGLSAVIAYLLSNLIKSTEDEEKA